MTSNRLTVGTFNIERLGWDEKKGHHRLPAALECLLSATPEPPDILALPEARYGLDNGQSAIREGLVSPLSRYLADGGLYEALMSSQRLTGRVNHLYLLLVNTRRVRILKWWDPFGPGTSYRKAGCALLDACSIRFTARCEHWSGGEGREEFFRAAQSVLEHAKTKTLRLGDFNADSGWSKECHHDIDWYELCKAQGNLHKLMQKGWLNPQTGRWEVDTRQIDMLRECGFRDMGEESDDPTPTTDQATGSTLRIDRIMWSAPFPAEVEDYHVVQPDRSISDHAYVFGTLAIHSR